MSTQLTPAFTADTHLAAVDTLAESLISNSKADNTLKAYRSDWSDFALWCGKFGKQPLPATPNTVALYIADLSQTHKPATIQRRIASISQAHQVAGFDTPTKAAEVQLVWQGIRRTKGTSQTEKSPLRAAQVRDIMEQIPDTLAGKRDRALLLLGFFGGFRRSELAALEVADVKWVEDGAEVTIRRSKTDQEGAGRKLGIPRGRTAETCPVRSLQAWLDASGISAGPIFYSMNRHGGLLGALTGQGVAIIVKRHVEAVGLNPDDFSGHSLRAGHATSAAANGATEGEIMRMTGHRSEAMVRRYVREGNLFLNNSGSALGL
jgi:integrase